MCEYCGCKSVAPIGELMEEHVALLDEADLVRGALTSRDRQGAMAHLTRLVGHLERHVRREEQGVFAALRAQGDFAGEVGQLESEHEALDAAIADLDPDASDFEPRLTRLLDALAGHIEREDLGIFPVSVVTLGATGWDIVDRAHRQVPTFLCDPAGDDPLGGSPPLAVSVAARTGGARVTRRACAEGSASSEAEDLRGRTVAEVMVTRPKTMGCDVSVGAVRTVFEDDHVHMVLLTEGGDLRGTVLRTDLAGADDAEPVLGRARLAGRTVPPGCSAERARQLLLATGERRFAVVDDRARLLGLLCLKRRRTGFCSDQDVTSRALERGAAVAR